MNSISYTRPSITSLEVQYASDAVANGWGRHCYDYIERFEKLFAERLNAKYAMATSSCTGAIHLGLAALGIGPGDEVIVADINWIASVAPIVHLGATPVLVDVLSRSWCIDPAKVEDAITPKTKAIVAVHLYGNVCQMSELLKIGERFQIPVMEDAAEAIGSSIGANGAGTLGAFGTFSFHGTKTMTTGEGGMLVTNDDSFYERVLTLSNHGRSRHQTKQFWPDEIGFKYKMSNVQAAIGCAQLTRIDDLIERKRQIFEFYQSELSELPVVMNPEPTGTTNGYWMPTVVCDPTCGVDQQRLLRACRTVGIDARPFFYPVSSLDFADVFICHQNTVSKSLSPRAINLPSYHDMTDDDQKKVISTIRNEFSQ